MIHPTIRAAIWMSGAVVSFSAMAIAGRFARVTLDTFEIMMYRSFIGVIIVLCIAAYSKTLHQISLRHLRQHILRNLAHFAGQNLWFYALPLIPLAQLFALEFTAPIWVILLAPFLVGERITKSKLLCAAIGFTGVLMVARPGAAGLSPGIITAALAAIGFALTALLTKRLTRTDSITAILFFLTATQAVFGVIASGYDGQIALPDTDILLPLFVIGCTGLMAHFCITRALSYAPASVVSPFDFARLPVIAVIGAVFYHESIHPLTILGAVVIFVANYLNILSNTPKKP